ncbi:class I SAM-dependent methyltransferase [Paenibacillus harenae]|uniref:class I SAM-dependent methyltransferase n=1 Tax=Paenibacillus harenae TaxID=306543 RepID=UPI002791165C|nr:class I SAM-dependent methyltransferase [Paenibacillus harenae]MDQ0059137.1 ubiquinone/menaquinone biosynthesis C-methylase UbiE [Paenibacillus harenae]
MTSAVDTLRKCGLHNAMLAMDLGCGLGHYTIPAAISVGSEGRVVAVDYDKKILKGTSQRLLDAGLSNVDITCANHLELGHVPDSSIDFLMIYDMIHTNPRIEIFPVIKRLLKSGGTLSVLAFGEIRIQKKEYGQFIKSEIGKNITDPYREALTKLHNEIQFYGFSLSSVVESEGVHFDHFHSAYHWKKYGDVRLDSLERGDIYNFANEK